MASGFETRQPAKQTFAFTGPNPVQVSPSAQGNSRGAQLVGGESRSGVVAGQEAAPMLGPQLGSFFEKVMEPHLQRRQQEEFIKGSIAQMGRQAGEEIKSSKGAFSKIFGQSSYVEGAVHYRVQEAVNKWSTDTLGKADDLKRMNDRDLAKYVSDSVTGLSSGDPYTDQMVTAAVFEQTGPVMQTIAKKRYVWQQEEASIAYGDNLSAAAGTFQQIAADAAKLSDPTDKDSAALVQATNNARASLMQPHGMDDETYKKSLQGAYRRAAESGNGYMVRLIKGAGFLNVLNDEDRTKMEDAELRYAKRASNSVLLGDPELAGRYTKLEAEARLAKLGHSIPGGVNGLGDRWRALNADIKRVTGFDHDVFDADAIVGKQMSGLDSVISAEQRRQDRAWQVEDREDGQQFQIERDAAEDAAENTAATLGWAAGQVRTAVAGGAKEPLINVLANNDYEQGDYSRIVKAYRGDGWVSPIVREKMQSKVMGSIGDQYSEATKTAHKEWATLNKQNPAAAMAYYGKWYPQMVNFDRLVGTLGPNTAFQRAFHNPQQYSITQMPPARRKEAAAEVKKAVDGMQYAWYNPFGRSNLNESSSKVVADAVWEQVAILSQYSSLPTAVLAQQAVQVATNDGLVERYGQFAWRNKGKTTPLRTLLGVQEDEADKLVTTAIDNRLKAAGFAGGANGNNYDIQRLNGPDGQPALFVSALDNDAGHAVMVTIKMADLKTAATQRVSASVAQGVPSAKGADPYRRIKGESGMDRLARINREVAAGADPVNHFNRK
jgi:hypothetical protein